MSYIVLARKLRPTRFDDLVGQETIAQTLKKAILSNRVSHAFLFTGPRGVGKTSGARILAKAINCLNPQGADPCNNCQNCQEITDNISPDVYEIDAASNRGIDNIRELRDNVKYVPAHCRYKVYIIDEAHMLTLESFNALLKTLEEPPSHVKFILATTDPHKIPQTIISRCQRYDFVRIPRQKNVDYLEKVIQAENIQISRKALEMIALHSVGGMRDSLSVIDQVISYSGQSATDEQVAQIIGMVDSQARFRLLSALIHKNPEKAMEEFYSMQQHGHDFQDILTELLQSLKNLSLVHTLIASSGKIPLTLFQDISQEEVESYQQMISDTTYDELQQIFHILLELEERIRRSNHAQVCFEMALMQITSIQPLASINELLEKVRDLKENEGRPNETEEGRSTESRPEVQKKNENLVEGRPIEVLLPPSLPTIEKKNLEKPDTPHPQNETVTEPTSISETLKRETENQSNDSTNPILGMSNKIELLAKAENRLEEGQKAVGSAIQPHSNGRLQEMPTQEWENFVDHVQQNSPRLGSILKNAVLLEKKEMEGHSIEICISFKEMQFNNMLSDEKLNTLNQLATQFYHQTTSLIIGKEELSDAEGRPVEGRPNVMTITEKRQLLLDKERARRRKVAEEDEQTQLILNTFPGSEIVDIQIQEPEI